MIKKLAAMLVATAMTCGWAQANILWGYESWNDTTPVDTQVDEWGTYNLDFIPDNVSAAPESLAIGTIGSADSYGKTYFGSGVGSDQFSVFQYLYLETYDIQGNMRVAVSGDGDADYFDLTASLVAGDTGDPSVIYNPGPYVFALSDWTPASSHANVSVQLIAEGGEGSGFTVNRVFITDDLGDTGFSAAVPEPSSALLIGVGMGAVYAFRRRRI